MKKVDMLVKAPHFYTMEGQGVGYKTGSAMVVDGGRIVDFVSEAAAGEYIAEEVLELPHHAVLPGFVDGHIHTGDCIMRGLAQDTKNWMMYGLQPFGNVVTEEERIAGGRIGLIEAVRNGTTTIGDYMMNMEPVCSFIEKLGARGNITQMIREAKYRTYNPGELYEFDEAQGERQLAENIALYDKWHGKADGRIRILFGPQGADFGSRDFLLKVQQEAKKRGTKVHMHVQQGDRETYQIVKRYGKRPVEWLREIGYLDDTLIAVHLTDCTEEEAAMVAETGATMLVCPGSIAIIDGIVCPSVAFQRAGGSVGLGSDQAPGNNCHSIINEMKLVALLNKIRYGNPEVLPAYQALRMATIEGARAVGLGDKIGSLEPGKQADFIAIDLSQPTMLPVYKSPMRNIVPNLVYSARGSEVCLSAVDGRVIYRDGKVLGVDEQECFAAAARCTDRIGEAASQEFWEIDGTNARFMKEGKL